MDQFEPALNIISITPNFAKEVRLAIRQNYASLKAKMKLEETSCLKGITDTEQVEDGLYTDLKRGLIDEEMYTRQVGRIRAERKKLMHLLFELQHSMVDTCADATDKILELATDAESLWKAKTPQERVEFLKRLLWNPRVTGQTIEYES